MLGKGVFKLLYVVVFQHQGMLDHFGRHAGAGGCAESGQTRASLYQQRISMAVVAALKLDELAAARGTTRQADGTHAGFGSRTDQSNHVHAGDQLKDFFGQFDLALGRCPEREAVEGGFLNGFDDNRIAVAQDHWTPGPDVVDIPCAFCVPEIRPLCSLYKAGCASYCLESANWGVDATRDDFLGAFKQGMIGLGHIRCAHAVLDEPRNTKGVNKRCEKGGIFSVGLS